MTGDKAIRDMRRAGQKPRYVWVSDFPNADLGEMPTVCVHGDTPEMLDLRFLVGCTAMVEGADAERVQRIAAACERAKAERVIANVHETDSRGFDNVVKITDTKGIATWPV